MLKTLTKLFKRDRERSGLARLGEYSRLSSERITTTKPSNQPERKPSQQISSSDLVENFAAQISGGASEGWPAPHLSVDQSAPADVDFFDQATGFAEVFPTTVSQRSAILGQKAPQPEYATTLAFTDDDDAEAVTSAISIVAPKIKQSIRVEALPISGAGQEMMDALRRLPALLEQASSAPSATIEALQRVDNLTNTLKSQHQLQRQATGELRNLRQEFEGFLRNITTTVSELKALHNSALSECSQLTEENRKALRSQRMHVIEMRRQQQDAYHRLETEQMQRIRSHELRSTRTVKKFGLACVAMLLMMVLCVGVFMRYTSSIIDSTSHSIRGAGGAGFSTVKADPSHADQLNQKLDALVHTDASKKPAG